MYREAFEELRFRAVQRHLMLRGEFDDRIAPCVEDRACKHEHGAGFLLHDEPEGFLVVAVLQFNYSKFRI